MQGVTEGQDEGVFTCHASNIAGNDSTMITLSVQGTPRIYSTVHNAYVHVYVVFFYS